MNMLKTTKLTAGWLTGLGLAFLSLITAATAEPTAGTRPNVLLLLVDDLKPVLGCYGDPIVQSPNLDRLAARSLRFDLAYCNQAVCAPSRFNLMLGSRSTSTGLYHLGQNLREVLPDAVTMPQYFSRHGYRTESLGKVFHIGHGNQGDPASFDLPHFKDKVVEYVLPESTGGEITREEAYFENLKTGVPNKQLPRGAAWEAADVPDDAYADGRVAAETIRRLTAWKERPEKPFFIAAGFARPHLPFTAPKKYWDLYDPAKLPRPTFIELPEDAPAVAGKRGGEITQYKPVPERGPIEGEVQRNLIHGYYASVSYVDAQIGKVLAALARLDLEDNTIVLLWGDHGFHLGDHGIWTKHTNYEQANRIPLLIAAPGVTTPGSSTRQLAETVDIFPTLAQLAGLPTPKGPQPLDGLSLVPVLRDPTLRVRDHAYHAFPKGKLGRAIRTERYRFVEWNNPGDPADQAELELYDYQTDPFESVNLAKNQPALVANLRAMLARHPEAKPVSR
jgi:iduronate 2-sulfatase